MLSERGAGLVDHAETIFMVLAIWLAGVVLTFAYFRLADIKAFGQWRPTRGDFLAAGLWFLVLPIILVVSVAEQVRSR